MSSRFVVAAAAVVVAVNETLSSVHLGELNGAHVGVVVVVEVVIVVVVVLAATHALLLKHCAPWRAE